MKMPVTNQPAKIFLDLMHPDDVHGEVSRRRIYDDDAVYIHADLADDLARVIGDALTANGSWAAVALSLTRYNEATK